MIRVFAVRMKKAWVLSYPLSAAQRRLWSDWVDAQADLSLRLAHSHFAGFVMRQLNVLELCDPVKGMYSSINLRRSMFPNIRERLKKEPLWSSYIYNKRLIQNDKGKKYFLNNDNYQIIVLPWTSGVVPRIVMYATYWDRSETILKITP